MIPPRYRGVSFDRPPVTDMARDLQTQGGGRARSAPTSTTSTSNLDAGRGLWLFGDTGTGKTTLAMLVSKAALEAGKLGRDLLAAEAAGPDPPTYDSEPGGDSYLSFFERLTSVDLLHIDDLGAEKRTDWVLEQLYALVNERYETQRSMLVTSNANRLDEGQQSSRSRSARARSRA